MTWTGAALEVLDQTLLPHAEVVTALETADAVADAIRRLAVRGAPLIGVAAAYGVVLAGADDAAIARLRAARPTAVNLAWAVDRVVAAPDRLAEAQAIEREDEEASAALARHGADALEAALGDGPLRLMTHCNTGALAASGRGTALGVVCELADRRDVSVLVCEARPLLQGARLTTWELARAGIPHELIVDSAGAGLIARGEVDAVITGFDRVAANGDVCNKVGTYGLALAAHAAGVPFVAAGPSSSVDADTPTGADIEVEERDAGEVLRDWAPPGTRVRNPAFDVTPAALVWALVTESGVSSAGAR
ncbi:MAG: methylthioribose-phosphate isomerase [Solirubrobacteraceae bacterium]|nr:methylthioribose-phosphate isomerase [Solirubrobacteraceae bacterium]